LSCGTPIVGFDAGAPSEVAPDGYGAFVPYADIDALEDATRRALDGGLRGKDECAAFGKERYAKEEMAQRYMGLYEG
jgi:glycosyltransferase involved in cell wall biosynthesis